MRDRRLIHQSPLESPVAQHLHGLTTVPSSPGRGGLLPKPWRPPSFRVLNPSDFDSGPRPLRHTVSCDSTTHKLSALIFPSRTGREERFLSLGGNPMISNEAKNEMLVTVLTDLAAICRKLAENSAVPAELRTHARQLVEEFDSLSPHRGKGGPAQYMQGEKLLIKISRFLPRVLVVEAVPNLDAEVA